MERLELGENSIFDESIARHRIFKDDPVDERRGIRYKTLIPHVPTYYPTKAKHKLQAVTEAPERGDVVVILNEYTARNSSIKQYLLVGVVKGGRGGSVSITVDPENTFTKQWRRGTVAKLEVPIAYYKAYPKSSNPRG